MKTIREDKDEKGERICYAIVLETIGSPEYNCTDENNNPTLFYTETDAWREVADFAVMALTEFIEGRREFDMELFEPDMHVIAVRIVDGKIVGESEGYQLIHRSIPALLFTSKVELNQGLRPLFFVRCLFERMHSIRWLNAQSKRRHGLNPIMPFSSCGYNTALEFKRKVKQFPWINL